MNLKKYKQDLGQLIGNNATFNNPKGLLLNVDFIKNRLIKLGFEVTLLGTERPVIHAFRKSSTSKKTIGIFNHYDVELTNDSKWNTTPTVLSFVDDRFYGRGIADNLGIWLLRMHAIEDSKSFDLPNIHWLFEGEEEQGSLIAHNEFPKVKLPKIDVWFEETGFFDLVDMKQKLLILNEDKKLTDVKVIIKEKVDEMGFDLYTENRTLTKFDKCPFLTHLLNNQPYLAIGPNDEYSNIHQPNESLSLPLVEKSFDQFKELLNYYSK